MGSMNLNGRSVINSSKSSNTFDQSEAAAEEAASTLQHPCCSIRVAAAAMQQQRCSCRRAAATEETVANWCGAGRTLMEIPDGRPQQGQAGQQR